MYTLEKATPMTKIDRFARQIHTISESRSLDFDEEDLKLIRRLVENILDQCKILEYSLHSKK